MGISSTTKNLTYLPINHPLSGEMQTYRYQNNRQKEQLNHIETLLADLRQKTSVSINSEVQFTRHSGESGLSQLTELKETVTLSLPLFDDVKLALNVSPSMMSSGKTPQKMPV